MSLQDKLADVIIDKASDCIVGPARGAVIVSGVDATVMPRGTLGTLADGRVVRVTQSVRVYSTGTSVPVRLASLAPAVPRGNFSGVAAGAVVTWTNAPVGIDPTAETAAAFGSGDSPCVASFVELGALAADADPFGTGASSDAVAILLDPEEASLKGAGSEHRSRRYVVQTTWKIRVNVSSLSTARARSVRARTIFDALSASLIGAHIGSGPVWFSTWRLVRTQNAVSSYEFAFTTQHVAQGRPVAKGASAPAFTGIDPLVSVNPND